MEEIDEAALSQKLQDVVSSFESIAKEINSKIKVVSQKAKDLEKAKKKAELDFAKLDSRINLNVGGQKFSTSRSTLTSIEGTYFYAMLSSEHWKPDSKGEYFIDRSPKHFLRIMDFLRSQKLSISAEGLTATEVQELKEELDYYQIPVPIGNASSDYFRPFFSPPAVNLGPDLQWREDKKGEAIVLSKNNKSAERLFGNSWQSVLGNQSVTSFRIQISKNTASSSTPVSGTSTFGSLFGNATNTAPAFGGSATIGPAFVGAPAPAFGDIPNTIQIVDSSNSSPCNIRIGLAPSTINPNTTNSKVAWFLCLNDGKLSSPRNQGGGRPFTAPFRENSIIIAVKYNIGAGTISFTIDGEDKGVAFQKVPPIVPLFPYIEFGDSGKYTAEILDS